MDACIAADWRDFIDCHTDDLDGAGRFWADALGMPVRELSAEESDKYVQLVDPQQHLHVEVQRVDHPSRVHLDIETDDLDAEVRRLEALGATRIAFVKRWWVMQAPSGQRFCVVLPATPDFEQTANHWD